MKDFFIRDPYHARSIIQAYNKCSNCSECTLSTPEGWRCSYLAECAEKYLERDSILTNEGRN